MQITKLRLVLWFVGALVFAEGAAQLSGVVDIPVYEANNQIGYIPAPNQAGKFLHKNSFRFNEYSMGAGRFSPDPARFNLLLVGDSIVLGGNPLAESERLGPQLEKRTGWQVWPISAGSWALQNELTYLRQHPDVLAKVDAVALVLNSGDFGAPSSWAFDLTHPQKRPFPALPWLIRKYALREEMPPVPTQLQVAQRDWRVDLKDFSNIFPKPIYVFMYPDLPELRDKTLRTARLDSRVPELAAILEQKGQIFKIAESAGWTVENYRDGIHPSGNGDAVLSELMSKAICGRGVPKMACP